MGICVDLLQPLLLSTSQTSGIIQSLSSNPPIFLVLCSMLSALSIYDIRSFKSFQFRTARYGPESGSFSLNNTSTPRPPLAFSLRTSNACNSKYPWLFHWQKRLTAKLHHGTLSSTTCFHIGRIFLFLCLWFRLFDFTCFLYSCRMPLG